MPLAKYAPLGDFFYRKHASRVVDFSMSFREFEAVIGADLPPSARMYRPWWANDRTHSQARWWLENGWESRDVDLTGERLRFLYVGSAM